MHMMVSVCTCTCTCMHMNFLKIPDTYNSYVQSCMGRFSFFRSYMDTEQYEEAVMDYEKIFKMDKTRGKTRYWGKCPRKMFPFIDIIFILVTFRKQTSLAERKAGAEEEQAQGLLQDSWCWQERRRQRDQESLQEACARPPPRFTLHAPQAY